MVLRHGQTEWSLSGQHTGRTDVELTPRGEAEAAAWAPELAGRAFAAVLCSPLRRATRTAELAGLTGTVLDPDLQEWDYGPVEGRTTAEVREQWPGWDLWTDGVAAVGGGPDTARGETLAEVGARCDRVLDRVLPLLERGDVALVAHGHLLRVLAARWLRLEPGAGALLPLDPAATGVLGHERERRVVQAWGVCARR